MTETIDIETAQCLDAATSHLDDAAEAIRDYTDSTSSRDAELHAALGTDQDFLASQASDLAVMAWARREKPGGHHHFGLDQLLPPAFIRALARPPAPAHADQSAAKFLVVQVFEVGFGLVLAAVRAAHVLTAVLGVGGNPLVVQVRSAQQRRVQRRFGHDDLPYSGRPQLRVSQLIGGLLATVDLLFRADETPNVSGEVVGGGAGGAVDRLGFAAPA
jgi:hypothetical protein